MDAKQYVQQRVKTFLLNAIVYILLLGIVMYFFGVPLLLLVANVLLLIGYVTIEVLEYKAWKNR